MSSNSIGTVFRIGLIALILFFFWFISVGIGYVLVSYILGFEFDFRMWIAIFCIVILYRMFIPKNVFV